MCEIFPIHYAPPYLANLNAVGEGEVLSVQLCVLVKGATTAAAARKRGKKRNLLFGSFHVAFFSPNFVRSMAIAVCRQQ